MADKYTYADVIIDPNDPRVEFGKEYYFGVFPKEALEYANKNGRGALLEDIDLVSNFPFSMENFDESAPCIIRKKEPEKKYVPFDLSKEEDRARLRGAWVRVKERTIWEEQITSLNPIFIFLGRDGEDGIKPDYLFNHYEFVDGTPCGKLVEEEDKWKEIAE